jgi:hypothetical protein
MSQGQPPPPGQPGPGQYPAPGQYPVAAAPASGKATTSLVLGIVSLVFCGLLLGIPAMIVARQAKQEIRASNGHMGGEGLATAGFVTGLLGTLWSVLATGLVVVVFIFGNSIQATVDENCSTVTDENGSSVTCD